MSRRRRRPGVMSSLRNRVKHGGAGKPTLEYINIILKDPCSFCGEYGCDSVDHIVPVCRKDQIVTGFGKDHWSNLAPCHRACNIKKGSRGLIHELLA